MNISIVKTKAFGGAAPRYKRLEDHRRCRGVTYLLLMHYVYLEDLSSFIYNR